VLGLAREVHLVSAIAELVAPSVAFSTVVAGVGEGRRGFAFSLPGETEAADRGGGSAQTRASSHRFPPP